MNLVQPTLLWQMEAVAQICSMDLAILVTPLEFLQKSVIYRVLQVNSGFPGRLDAQCYHRLGDVVRDSVMELDFEFGFSQFQNVNLL